MQDARSLDRLACHGMLWRTVEQVEIATLEYVDWFDHRRLHSAAADLPPAELETAHYRQHHGHPEPRCSTL